VWRLGGGDGSVPATSVPDAPLRAVDLEPPAPGGLRISLLLFLFGAGIALPSLGLTGFLLERHWQAQEIDIERRLEQVVGDLGHDIDRDITLLLANLTSLAASPDVVARRLAAVHANATASLKPLGVEVLYRDLGGKQLMNTRLPWGSDLPTSSQPEIDPVVRETMKPHISDLISGTVAQQRLITLTAPVVGQGELQGFLHLSIVPERFLATLRSQNLPPEWNTGLSDRKGLIIARLQKHEEFAGQKLPEELLTQSRERIGVFRTTNVEGVKTVRAVYRSPLTGWLVSANLPQSVADAAWLKGSSWMLGVAGVLLALTLVLALLFGRLISRPIRALADLAGIVEHEHVPAPLRSPVQEVNAVALTLRGLAGRLQQRSRELRQALERFNAALRGADVVVYTIDRDRRLTWISETAGGPHAIGLRSEQVLPADLQASAIPIEERALATGQAQQGEVRHGNGDAARYFHLYVEPLRDAESRIAGLLGVSFEITSLKQSERRNAFLVLELAHRSKNLLTVVQAIAAETMRGSSDVDDFTDRLASRLLSLSKLQDLTVSGNSGIVELAALVRSQLEPFVDPDSGRIAAAGPPVLLRPPAANSLAMALHELATNAAKYGALSTPEGRIDITWRAARDDAGGTRFHMRWQERDGPAVVPPQRRGFGRKVLTKLTTAALSGTVDLEYAAQGLRWTIDAPWERIASDPSGTTSAREAAQ
jgi:two-component sensor histidine kinase